MTALNVRKCWNIHFKKNQK